MRLLDSRFYWWVNRLSSYLLLSGLWLLCSSLVVTLIPATAAMFAVFRAWQDNPDDAFYLPFFTRFRQHFVKDFLLGLLWLLAAGLLVLDALLLPQVPPAVRVGAFALLALGTVLYAAATMFIFPLLVSYSLSFWAYVRAAVILGMTQFGTTALCAGVVVLTGAAFWMFPPSLLITPAVAGHLVHELCRHRMERVFT